MFYDHSRQLAEIFKQYNINVYDFDVAFFVASFAMVSDIVDSVVIFTDLLAITQNYIVRMNLFRFAKCATVVERAIESAYVLFMSTHQNV